MELIKLPSGIVINMKQFEYSEPYSTGQIGISFGLSDDKFDIVLKDRDVIAFEKYVNNNAFAC